MNESLPEELKNQLKNYVTEQARLGLTRNKENISLYKALYEIEQCVHDMREDLDTKIRFDHALNSENVQNSFRECYPNQFHRPVDYQYPYLFWLFDNYKPGAPLIGLIESFFRSTSQFLNYPDVVLTGTGVTRCKTNLRLCTNTLRDWGILLRTDERNQRSFGMSTFGLLLIAYLKFEARGNPYSTLSAHYSIRKPGKYKKINIDERIVDAYYFLKRKEGFDSLLEKIKGLDLTAAERKAFASYKDHFIELFIQSIELRRSGIKQTKKDSEVISAFVSKTERSKEFKIIKEKLQGYFSRKNG